MSAKSEPSSDSPEVVCTKRYFEEEEAADEEATEELVEEKMPETDGISSQASLSSPEPLSVSPIIVESSPGANGVPLEMNLNFTATAIDGQHEWNGLVVESSVSDEFFDGTVNVETAEQCFVAPNSVPPNGAPLGPQFVSRPHVHSHPVCPGGTLHYPPGPHSPHVHSPGAHSSGSSPYDSGNSSTMHQYVVNVHVGPGETFSVRVGDEVQLIQGPATVRMVSNSGPPMPMPMQGPPGHMVQQIVDENGILTHVYLSPQISSVTTPPMMGAANGTPPPMYPPYGPFYGSFPSSCVLHHHPLPPRSFHHGVGSPHLHGTKPPPPPHQCSGQNPHATFESGNAGPYRGQGIDYRTKKIKARLQEKVNRRRVSSDGHQKPMSSSHESSASSNTVSSLPSGSKSKENHVRSKSDSYSRESSVDEQDLEEECKMVRDLLSKMPPPEVSAIESRCALVRLLSPDFSATDLEVDPSELAYVVQLSDKKESNFKTVHSGGEVEVSLTKLVPATEYYLRAFCKLDDLQGDLVHAAPFRTQPSEPDAPLAPKLVSKSKTSIQLKWTASTDNGSKITSYVLEYNQGTKDVSKFVEIYNGPQKQFKVTKLVPSVGYIFRLAAVNAVGKSGYSNSVCYCTSGTVPSQTDPPMLSEPSVKSLTISWIRRPSDDSFTLQMEDDATGHGFLTVYNGSELSYKVVNLRRNTEYKFRLQASNDEGNGKWSDVVSYRTLPDQPGPPPKPQLKGRALSNSFKVYWDPPKDNGGTEVNSYLLQLDDGSKTIHATNEREFTAEQLQPGFTYKIRVQAVGPGGTGDWSEVLLVTTQAVNPGQCKPPRLHGRAKAIFLNLTWDCPGYDGGSPVTDYVVAVTNPDGTTREVYDGHDTECGVAGLLPGRAYQFKVKAVNKAGAGPWSDSLEVVTGAGVPEAPVQPEIHCKSPHNAVVSWTEPNNNGAVITEYRLEWQPKENLDFVPLYCGTALSHDLSRLSPSTVYGFRVQAVNSAGVGPFSMVAECLTPSSSPGPVGLLRAIPTATSVQLSWKEPPNNGCRITYYNIDLGERHLISVENVTDYVIENLIPESTYKIRIQAVNSIGVGTFGPPIKVTTRALPPLAPSLECVSAGPKFLKLKWGDGKNTDLIQYCLEMMRENGNFQAVYQGTAQTHKVTKLNELCHYHFRIFATNEAGDGPLSGTFEFATTRAPPGILKPPKVSEIGMTSCIVEWSPLKPVGLDTFVYVLQLLATNDKDQQYHEVYRGDEQVHQLSSLQPRTNYQIRVCAIRICRDNSEGLTGPYSPSTLFTTSGSKPLPTVTNESVAVKTTAKLTSFQLSDSQWAFLILLGFALCAVIVAFGAKHLIERTSNAVTS